MAKKKKYKCRNLSFAQRFDTARPVSDCLFHFVFSDFCYVDFLTVYSICRGFQYQATLCNIHDDD